MAQIMLVKVRLIQVVNREAQILAQLKNQEEAILIHHLDRKAKTQRRQINQNPKTIIMKTKILISKTGLPILIQKMESKPVVATKRLTAQQLIQLQEHQ